MTVPVPDEPRRASTRRTLAEIAMRRRRAGARLRRTCARRSQRCAPSIGDGPPPRILICGSLYLAGSVLKENGPLPE